MDDNIYKNYQVMEDLWIGRGAEIVKLLRTNAALVEALEALMDDLSGEPYDVRSTSIGKAKAAIKQAKGE